MVGALLGATILTGNDTLCAHLVDRARGRRRWPRAKAGSPAAGSTTATGRRHSSVLAARRPGQRAAPAPALGGAVTGARRRLHGDRPAHRRRWPGGGGGGRSGEHLGAVGAPGRRPAVVLRRHGAGRAGVAAAGVARGAAHDGAAAAAGAGRPPRCRRASSTSPRSNPGRGGRRGCAAGAGAERHGARAGGVDGDAGVARAGARARAHRGARSRGGAEPRAGGPQRAAAVAGRDAARAGRGAGAAARRAGREDPPQRGGRPPEERVPRQHEPRDPDAAQLGARRSRSCCATASRLAVGRSARATWRSSSATGSSCSPHQRHPRPVAHRGRAPGAGRMRRSTSAADPRDRRPLVPLAETKGLDLRVAPRPTSGRRALRRRSRAPDPDQPDRQRHQVHRERGQVAGLGRDGAATSSRSTCTDTGVGIPDSAKAKVFEEFFQVDRR